MAPIKAASGQSGMTMERQLQQLHLEQQQLPGYYDLWRFPPNLVDKIWGCDVVGEMCVLFLFFVLGCEDEYMTSSCVFICTIKKETHEK